MRIRESGHVVPALALHDVEAVQRARLDPHQHIHPVGRRVGHVDVFEHLGAAAVVVADGLHFKPRMKGLASAAGWRTRVAKIVIATIVTMLGAIAKNAGSMDW